MKKTILTVALVATLASRAFAQGNATAAPAAAAPAAPSSPLSDLTVSASMDYESQYIFRGKKVTNGAFQPSAQFGYPIYGGSLYVGAWTSQPLGHAGGGAAAIPGPNQHNEIDLFGGYTYPLDMITKSLGVDVGYMYYWYPDASAAGSIYGTSDNQEIHLGFTYDTSNVIPVNLSPTLYFYHDFVLDQNDVEFGLSYTWDLSSLTGVKGVTLVPSATLGWLGAHNSFGQVFFPGGAHWRNSYTYYKVQLNLNYQLNSWAQAFIGVRYSGNNDGTAVSATFGSPQAPGSANSIWGGAGLNFSD